MMCYKPFKVRKDGSIGSLFINRRAKYPIGVRIDAESYPTRGYAFRPFWHCTSSPIAPHLSMNGRRWYKVEIKEYTSYTRPKNQGGIWYLAKKIKILEPV